MSGKILYFPTSPYYRSSRQAQVGRAVARTTPQVAPRFQSPAIAAHPRARVLSDRHIFTYLALLSLPFLAVLPLFLSYLSKH